jgi:N-acetylmuramoyl-L-alanine amidase
MCLDGRGGGGAISRRGLLGGAAALTAVSWSGLGGVAHASQRQVPAPLPVEVAPGLVILRRDSWGGDLPGPAALPTEAPGDVRVLLVHHSASANGYGEDAVVDQIRQFHALHTGPERGWPDVAYNVFVDRFGRAWEGRSGSVDGPVIGDATGGNQGFSQLVCLIGNHEVEAPSAAALDTLARVLAWLAARDGVDVTAGATTTFPSRGSNRWPAGSTVDTTTIAGHRDMSQTACPGDAAYARVRGDLPALVAARAAELAAANAPPAPAAPGHAEASAAPKAAPTPAPLPRARPMDTRADPASPEPSQTNVVPLAVTGAAAVVAVAAVAVPVSIRRRRACAAAVASAGSSEA